MKIFTFKNAKTILTGTILALLLSACSSQRIVTTWKTDHILTKGYKKILVIAVLPVKDSLSREKTENNFVTTLQDMGYESGSALQQFGVNGLSNSGEEDTYLRLYNKGYDAVLTVALIRKTKQNFHRPGQAYIHPNSYYFNRIIGYKNIPVEDTAVKEGQPEYFWESILFDLSALEAACTVRTQPFEKDREQETSNDLAKRILKKITREKILQKEKMSKAF